MLFPRARTSLTHKDFALLDHPDKSGDGGGVAGDGVTTLTTNVTASDC